MKIIKTTSFILIFASFQLSFAQNVHTYLPKPNEDKISEIKYIFENGAFWSKEKYYYNPDLTIDKIEELNPFNIVFFTKKYNYDDQRKLILINKFNNFDYCIEQSDYQYFVDRYIVTTFNNLKGRKDVKIYDLKNRMIEHQTYIGLKESFRYVYDYIYGSPEDHDYFVYDSQNNLERKQTLKFIENKKESVTIDYDDKGKINFNKQFQYNTKGEILEIAKFDGSNNVVSKQQFSYNNNDQISTIITVDDKNTIIEKIIFKYNDEKLKESIVTTNENGKFAYKTLLEYDKNNNLIKETFYDTEIRDVTPKFDNEIVILYKNGKIIENHLYDDLSGKKQISKKEYYDPERRITKEVKYYLGKISIETTYKNGFASTENKYNEYGKVYKITNFSYDDKGNILGGIISDLEYNYQTKFSYSYDKNGMKSVIEVE